jgi:hypothetical protein
MALEAVWNIVVIEDRHVLFHSTALSCSQHRMFAMLEVEDVAGLHRLCDVALGHYIHLQLIHQSTHTSR